VAANSISTRLVLLYVLSDFKHEISKVITDLVHQSSCKQFAQSSAVHVRWDKCGTQPAEDYTIFYGKKEMSIIYLGT
jgi:hypothetical protein